MYMLHTTSNNIDDDNDNDGNNSNTNDTQQSVSANTVWTNHVINAVYPVAE